MNLTSCRTLLLAQDHQVGLQEEEADPGGGRGRRRGAGAGMSQNYFLLLILMVILFAGAHLRVPAEEREGVQTPLEMLR